MDWNKSIVWITTIILVLFEIYSLTTQSHYKYDFIFLMAMLWIVYFFRNTFHVHPLHMCLLAIFLVLHNMGTFGAYEWFWLGIEYDFYVHTYFGFFSALMIYRGYKRKGPYKGWVMILAILVVVLGMSAFHEIFEYAGAVTVGEGEGVLFVGAGDIDEWDTQKDMRNNLFGGIGALIIYGLYEKIPRKKKKRKK